jgi:5-methylcytosine-specific restriction enzyme A
MLFYNHHINISTTQWKDILHDQELIDDKVIPILLYLYHSKKHEASGGEIAKALHYVHHAPLNVIVPNFAKRILRKYPRINPPKRANGKIRYWHIPFLGTEGKGKFTWILREELATALSDVYALNHDELSYPEEVEDNEVSHVEGGYKQIYVNTYERDPHARKTCLQHHGYTCTVCGFNFEKMYGPIGRGIIHVHHIKPISSYKTQHEVNPMTDLIPVCPNCHAMIHSRKEPLAIEDLRDVIQRKHQKAMNNKPLEGILQEDFTKT